MDLFASESRWKSFDGAELPFLSPGRVPHAEYMLVEGLTRRVIDVLILWTYLCGWISIPKHHSRNLDSSDCMFDWMVKSGYVQYANL